MIFTEMGFIFRFLPIFLIIFYIVPRRFRETVLLLASLIFYGFGELTFLPLLVAATVVNYLMGRNRQKKVFLITAIVLDVLLLAVFKGLSISVDSRLLPLGISFYLFRMISYQADLLRGDIRENPRFRDVALYFCMFPQVLSGPIMRYGEGEFDYPREYRLKNIEDGIKYFVIGLGMKILLADRLVILWNDIQTVGFASISTPMAWLGMMAYSLQLYFDFWGYSLMAAGIGMMVGFEFIRNFDHPYAARSVSEFYRRWHMTLGSWFRDYVYIPLGGSRAGFGRLVFNLMTVWLLTGIWHGSGFNYIIWGVILGSLIVIEKLWIGKFLKRFPLIGNLYMILLIPLTWIVFAINDLGQLAVYFRRLFPFLGTTEGFINQGDYLACLKNYGIMLIVGILLCFPRVNDYYQKHKQNVSIILSLLAIFWFSIYFVVSQEGNPFAYLKF